MECIYDFCLDCEPEYILEDSNLLIGIELQILHLEENLPLLISTIREDDRARDYLMRKFRFVPLLHKYFISNTTANPETKSLVFEAIWYFTRSSYCVMCIFKSSLLQRLVDELEIETDVSNLKKIVRAIYNITLVYPTQQTSSGLRALSLTPNFLKNLAIPLLLDDTELLTVCLDILDSLSNSTLYFKANLVFPDTTLLQVLPRLLSKEEGIASRTAYFMWVLVAIDNNKKSLCRCPGILPALKRIIDENFDGGRANAFGTLWNLAALAVNKVAICDPALGLVTILVRLINEGDEGTKISALGVTSNLSVEVQNKPLLLDPNVNLLSALVRQVRESSSTPRVTACQTLMNLGASELGDTISCNTYICTISLNFQSSSPRGFGNNEDQRAPRYARDHPPGPQRPC
jgi:hypothetical protein